MGACETHVGIVHGLLPGKARVRDAGAWPAAADSMIFLLKRRADIWVCRAQEKRQWDAALERYDAALAACANAPPAFAPVLHADRAAAHQAQENIADAIADSWRAKAQDRTYAKVWGLDVGWVYFVQTLNPHPTPKPYEYPPIPLFNMACQE